MTAMNIAPLSHRSTFTLGQRARQIAEQRAKQRRISLGEAITELIEQAEDNAPRARLVIRPNGLPMFVTPPGSPKIDTALVRQAIEEDW